MSVERLGVAASSLSYVTVRSRYYQSKKGRKRIKSKEKGGGRYKTLEIQKEGRKANREEKTQHN
jgi:hypothetical protein